MSETIEDSPTERTTFDQLTYESQIILLESIRERRLTALRVYEDLLAKKQAVQDEKLSTKAGKLCARIEKKLAIADKAISDIEGWSKDIKAMIMEMDHG